MPTLFNTIIFLSSLSVLLEAPHLARGASSALPLEENDAQDAPAKDPKSQPACITHTSQARYISGFNHLVTIKNDCDHLARCQVSTDVNPEIQNVIVQKKTSETVLTYRGSPARTFVAKVECRLDGQPAPDSAPPTQD